MKKLIFIFIVLSLFTVSAFCDEFFDTYTGIQDADIYNGMQNTGNLWENQKPITDKEFEAAIDSLQTKQKQKEAKQRKKKIKKVSGGGTSLHPGLDPANNEISELEPLKTHKEEGRLVNIPVDLLVDDGILEKGFYNVYGEKDNEGNVFISFYQSQFLKGKVKAKETQYDFESDDIDFAKFEPYDDNYVRIMYGSLDFNAYVYLLRSPEESE